jgi:uncharacterized membrane protein (DUF485 family)
MLNSIGTDYKNYSTNLGTIDQNAFQEQWVNPVFADKLCLEGITLNKTTPEGFIIIFPIYFNYLTLSLSPAYRFIWKNAISTGYNPVLLGDEDFLKNQQTDIIKGTLGLGSWNKLTPSTVIDICSQNIKDPFYYNLLGYRIFMDNKPFVAPPLSMDINTIKRYVKSLCSLRLLNSKYKGPCVQIINNGSQYLNFDTNTRMVDITGLTAGHYYQIVEFFDQFDNTDQNLTGNSEYCPSLHISEDISSRLIPNIIWGPNQSLFNNKLASGGITLSIGMQYIKDSQKGKCINILTMPETPISIIDGDKITINAIIPDGGPINAFLPDNLFNGNVHALSIGIDAKQFRQDKNILCTFNQNNDCHISTGQSLIFFYNNAKDSPSIYCPQIIVFSTDSPVATDVLDLIDEDFLAVWSTSFLNNNMPDLRCIDIVPEACKIDRRNVGCACYPTFINENGNGSQIDAINKNKFINTDPWCIIPECASITAYKNPIQKNLSTCSSNCIASISANTKKYGNLNMDDVQVSTSCYNQESQNLSFMNDCNPSCTSGFVCKTDPSNPSSNKCIKSSVCDIECKPGYTCFFSTKGDKKCISSNYTVKCINNTDCGNDQYCDPDFNLCFPKTTDNKKITVPIIVFFTVLLIGFIGFIAYKKHKKLSTNLFSKINIIVSLIIFAVAILVSLIIYFTEKSSEAYDKPNNNNNVCSTDNDCSINDHTSCNNNICSCTIGYNNFTADVCNINNNQICTTLPYLPFATSTGIYCYSTVIENVIYVFAQDCSFKFNGQKWIELSRINIKSPTFTQLGFHPYGQILPISRTNWPSMNGLNTNMFCTYKNKVFVLIPDNTCMNINTEVDGLKLCVFFVYNTITDIWTQISLSSDDNIKPLQTLSVSNKGNDISSYFTNNVIMTIIDDSIYIFGGLIQQTVNNYSINNAVFIYNITNDKWSEPVDLNTNIKYIFSSYSAAHISIDKKIYIVGVSTNTGSTYIYKYDPGQTTFFSVSDTPLPYLNDLLNGRYNNGLIISYYVETITNEYIVIMGKTNNENLITTYDITNSKFVFSAVFNVADENLLKLLFERQDATIINASLIDGVVCKFELNGFLFMITGNGEIFRFNNYKTNPCIDLKCPTGQICDNGVCTTRTSPPPPYSSMIDIVPCYGITSFDKPKYNNDQSNPIITKQTLLTTSSTPLSCPTGQICKNGVCITSP